MAKTRWARWFTWFGPSEHNTLRPQEICLNSLPARFFYSSRSDSHIETRGLTGGPEVVETLYNI
jgi:hypothetical protein